MPKDHLYVLLAVGMWEGHWRRFETEISGLKLELADYLRRDGKGRFELADCEVKSKHRALIVMDDTGKQLNSAVAMKHAWFQRAGNRNTVFPAIVEYPFFTRSELSNGVQLADPLAYSVYRAFKREDIRYRYFERLLPNFYRRREGATLDGLKVWPEDSPLVRAARNAWDSHK